MKGNTLNVMFFILKNKLLKNGEAPVVLRVTINGQRDEIRIQRSIPVELWDNAKMRSKGKDRSSRELNMYLETLRDRIYVIHRNSVYDGEKTDSEENPGYSVCQRRTASGSEGHEGMHRRMGGFSRGFASCHAGTLQQMLRIGRDRHTECLQ